MQGLHVAHFGPLSGSVGQSALWSSLASKLKVREASLIDSPTDTWTCALIAVTPSVKDVAHGKHVLAQLLARNVPRHQIFFYGRHMGCPGGLTRNVIEEEVGPLIGAWPFDPELALSCENEGCSIEQKKPKSPLAKAIAQTAEQVLNRLAETAPSGHSGEEVAFSEVEKDITNGLWRQLQESLHVDVPKQIDLEIDACLVNGKKLVPQTIPELRRRVQDNVLGYGPLQKWMTDDQVNEIMVNAGRVFVEKAGRMIRTDDMFESEKQLRIVIDRMVVRSGRRVDLSSPMVDIRLPDGSRVNIILPPLSLNGPAVTVRKFRPQFRSMDDLIQAGSISYDMAQKLREAVEQRKNILIAGNTGAGKTTLLNVLSGFIPPDERIITLEDTAELSLQQSHVVRLETRPRNAEGAGCVSMADLLVNALRMRPDRLIIGECRGAEVVPMIQAMNTGHDGCISTVHANSAADAVGRLESMISMAVPQWPTLFVREQLAAALDVIVYLKRQGASRKVTEMTSLRFVKERISLENV